MFFSVISSLELKVDKDFIHRGDFWIRQHVKSWSTFHDIHVSGTATGKLMIARGGLVEEEIDLKGSSVFPFLMTDLKLPLCQIGSWLELLMVDLYVKVPEVMSKVMILASSCERQLMRARSQFISSKLAWCILHRVVKEVVFPEDLVLMGHRILLGWGVKLFVYCQQLVGMDWHENLSRRQRLA